MNASVRLERWAALTGCVAITAAIFWAPDPDARLRSALAIHDFGHVLAFGLVTALVAVALRVPSRTAVGRRLGATCLAAFAAVALGAAVEMIQAASGLHGDPWDVVRDGGGAISAALLIVALDPAIPGSARAAVTGAAIVVLLAFAFPIFTALEDEARARAQFPVLASFESTKELSRFRFAQGKQPGIVGIEDHEGRPVSAMRLRLLPARYSGFALKHFPGDWRGLRALRLLVVNPEPAPVELTVRIDDAGYDSKLDIDDRYNRSFPLVPGLNRIEIPLTDVAGAPRGRTFDLGHVRLLLLYVVDLEEPRSLIVGPISLLR
jgi:hypothetical protein